MDELLKIISKIDGYVLFERKCSSPKELLELAVKNIAYLWGADLRDADLRGADLTGADLGGADLRGADLDGCLLGGC